MRNRRRTVVKRTWYVPPEWAEGFKRFAREVTSEEIQYAMVAWAAQHGQARDEIMRQTTGLPFAEAVRLARRLMEQVVIEQCLLRYVKTLPKQKQLKILREHKG